MQQSTKSRERLRQDAARGRCNVEAGTRIKPHQRGLCDCRPCRVHSRCVRARAVLVDTAMWTAGESVSDIAAERSPAMCAGRRASRPAGAAGASLLVRGAADALLAVPWCRPHEAPREPASPRRTAHCLSS